MLRKSNAQPTAMVTLNDLTDSRHDVDEGDEVDCGAAAAAPAFAADGEAVRGSGETLVVPAAAATPDLRVVLG